MSWSRGHVPCVAIFVIVVTWTSHFQAAAEVISVSVPFVSPKGSFVTQQDRYHTFRIPGMVVTQDGSVLVFAEGRRGDGDDPRIEENAPIDLVMRRSTDNGQTWSDREQVFYPDEPHETSDGFYWRQAQPGPGNGIQLQWQDPMGSRNGRLIIPAKRRGSSTPDGLVTVVEPFVYYSDDHGKTWHVGNVTPGPDANEAEVVELIDGRVLLDARQNSGNFRRRHLSTDGGVTRGPDSPDDIPITPVDGSMVRYSAKRATHDRDRILFSGPRDESGLNRNNITVWTSYDEGKTFTNPVQFNNGFSAYSVVQRLADGTIGLVVETANDAAVRYGEITFYRFDIAELEAEVRRQ